MAQFFTAPNMAKDAALRITKARVELLTEPEHLHMIEQSVRGGITSVFETRYFKANNQFLPGFNPEEASTFGLCLDANNLYGGVMQKELLPIGSFRFANEVSISQILNMPQDSAIGYFAEVDLECPTDVHDNQRDYPLAPVKEIVQDVWLSDFQINLKEQYNIPEAKVPKLLQTLFDKKNYVVHYKLLQLYVQLGLRITKLHRVLQFNQERWLEPYITLNSNMRKNATNKFQQNYYKLMCFITTELLQQFREPDADDERITIFANSLMTPVYAEGLSNDNFVEMVEKMLAVLFTFASSGSGWMLERVIRVNIKFAKYRPATGSSFIALPTKLQNCRALLNIRNHTDNNCFIYSFIAASYLKCNNFEGEEGRNESLKLTSPEFYQNMPSLQPAGEFSMPMGFNDIDKFETLNDVEVNVFGFENRDLFPMRVSKRTTSELSLDLLLLYENDKHHYVLIKDLCRLFCFIKNIKFKSTLHLCRNCLYLCHKDFNNFKDHVEVCGNIPPAVIRMPKPDNNLYKFTNWSATWFAPLVIYFDFESFLKPVASCAPSEERASSRPIEVHEPCGFALTVIEHGNPEPKFTHLDSSENCMQNFVQMIHKLAKDIHEQKRKHPFFRGDRSSLHKDASKQCWICEKEFSETDEKDLDHCHYSGGFLGWAHPQCNRARRNSNFIPVIGHNIQNYDLHHICLSLQKCEQTTTINVIPATDEKYIAMMLGVQVDRVERADKKIVPVYEYLRFVDSYKLFNGSLEKLVESLPESEFGIMESMFAHIPAPDRQLLKQKGYYPYSYMSDRSKYAERELPAISKWTNSLENGKISINESELDKAKKMWQLLNCETMPDYHDS